MKKLPLPAITLESETEEMIRRVDAKVDEKSVQ